ncbi:MAG: 3-phosphoglycerate dehydrogenase [Bacillota bacterium]|nr:MAG: 3-phosphoglycerate dehydrogenase [Bacillota bacterium]
MKNVLKLNAISDVANEMFPADYRVTDNAENPVGIMLRSFSMHEYDLPESVLAVARAGAGTNNIPSDVYAQKGVVVFNTPGANANAVKELVLAALFASGRKLAESLEWVNSIADKGDEIPKLVEKGKKNFVGHELKGKTIGIIGLGAIGAQVANATEAIGMKVLGYDPYLSVENALSLTRKVHRVQTLDEIAAADYVTVHVPLLSDNKGFLNKDFFAKMKNGAVLLNMARGELVNNDDVLEAVASGKLAKYVCDFPCEKLIGKENVLCFPHLGASTPEAEDNCAVMAAKQLVDYIENGNIVNSVNFPACSSARCTPFRISVLHKNQKNMIAQISSILAQDNINIENFENKNKGENAYTILDIASEANEKILKQIAAIDGVYKVREIR